MLKVAFIGIGRWGKILLGEFSKNNYVQLAMSRHNSESQTWLKKYFPQVEWTNNLEKIIGSDVDAIVISSPPDTHYNYAKKALTAGKHVFLEKPPATSVDDIDNLLKAAQKKSLAIFVDNIYRYDHAFRKFEEIVKEQEISEVEFKWMKWGTFEENIFWNLVYHEIYLAISLFGKVLSFKVLSNINNKDVAKLEIYFSEGKIAKISVERNFREGKTKSLTAKSREGNLIWKDGKTYKNDRIISPKSSPLENVVIEFTKQVFSEGKDYRELLLAREAISLLTKINLQK